jgi:hypothetical protein
MVKKFSEEKIPDLSPVLIPEDAKLETQERYGLVEFVCAASDCDNFLKLFNPDQPGWATWQGTSDDVFITCAKKNGHIGLVVDNSMVEEVKIQDKKFHVVHQNYIIGVIDE